MSYTSPPGTLAYRFKYETLHEVDADTPVLCSRCHEWKPGAEFYLDQVRSKIARTGSYRDAALYCRGCSSTEATRYRSDRRAILDAHKAGGCIDCGLVNLDHPEIFDFDHVRGVKVQSVAAYITKGTVEGMLEEITRCDLVCANCHRIRTRGRVHGSRGRDRINTRRSRPNLEAWAEPGS